MQPLKMIYWVDATANFNGIKDHFLLFYNKKKQK